MLVSVTSNPDRSQPHGQPSARPESASAATKALSDRFIASAVEIWLGFGLAVATLLMVGAVAFWSTREFADTTRWVTHTYRVIDTLRDLRTASTRAEDQNWAAILAGASGDLVDHKQIMARFEKDLAQLQILVRDNPVEVKNLKALEPLMRARIALSADALAQARRNGQRAGVAYALAHGWVPLGAEIERRVREMAGIEHGLLDQRQSRESRTAQFSIRIIVYGSLAALLFVGFAAVFIERVLRRLRAATEMAQWSARQAEERGRELANQIQTVRRAEARFRNLIESATDTILTVNSAGEITYANPRTLNQLGYQPADLVGRKIEILVPEEIRATHPALRAKFFGNPVARLLAPELDIQAVRKDGTRFPVEVSLSPIESSGGIEALATIRDMTEYKKAGEYRAMLSAIVETSSYAIATLTPELAALTWNAGSEKVYGYAAHEMLGRRIDILSAPGRAAEAFAPSLEIRAAAVLQEFETQARRKDGAIIDVAVSIAPIRDQRGRLTAFSAISYDITERKRAEAELVARTKELARSNAELEQFAYVASHDLQEPLRMVASYLQLIAQRYAGRLDPDADEFINFAVEGARRMKQLINDLLNYSRAGRGPEPTTIDLEAALRRALDSLALAIEESHAEITSDPLPHVLGDENRLYEVFQNLIGNALKFRGADAPRIHVGAVCAGREWTISVADNGIGIGREYKNRIFAMFQRLHGRDEYPGTGIGLAICKRIIGRFGGRIWVESEAGHGAVFRFTLGAGEVDDDAKPTDESRTSGYSAG